MRARSPGKVQRFSARIERYGIGYSKRIIPAKTGIQRPPRWALEPDFRRNDGNKVRTVTHLCKAQ